LLVNAYRTERTVEDAFGHSGMEPLHIPDS